MFPVFFSVKKIRPSGVNFSETGKLRLVRIGVTGDAGARACDKKCGAINRMSMQVTLIASLVDFGSIESNRNSVRVTIITKKPSDDSRLERISRAIPCYFAKYRSVTTLFQQRCHECMYRIVNR